MKDIRLQTFAFLSTLIIGSCGPSLKVTSDYDKTVDFKKFKTFSMYKSDSLVTSISSLNQDRIVNAIRTEMGKKGYVEDNASPDMLVNPVAVVKDKVDVSSTTNYYANGGAYRPYWGLDGSVSSYTSYNLSHYKDGSLIIDVIDAGTKKIVWQGAGNSKIDGAIKDADTRISEAIEKIMEDLPSTKAIK